MKYITNFCRGCFSHWTASKAITELVQNYLDSEGEQSFEFGDDYIVLSNQNIKVSNKLLLMGKSDKREDSSKRGQFGVGSVQAMVVLIDLGYSVSIHNNDVVWTPAWEHCEKFGEDVMVIHENISRSPNNNFTITITGLDSYVIDEVKQRSLAFQEREVLYSTKYGDIVETVDGVGEVFVGDLFVCQTNNFKYSYNIKPKLLQLSQDRNAVSEWDLQDLTAKIIVATENLEFIRSSIEAKTLDTMRINVWHSERATPQELNDQFAKEFVEEYAGHIVTSSYSEHEKNERLGNKSRYIDNPRIVEAIQNSIIYHDSLENVEIVKEDTFETIIENLLAIGDDVVYDRYVNKEVLRGLIDNIRNRIQRDGLPF